MDGESDATVDAPIIDASIDGADADAGVDGGLDAADAEDGVADAPGDGVVDAPVDAVVDAADGASAYCGDGIRDPLTEECDDGVVSPNLDSCTSMCQVRDLLAYQAPVDTSVPERTLGLGRHPVAADVNGFAAAWIEPAAPAIHATFYDEKGVPAARVDDFGVSSTVLTTSDPVLAALGNGKYAAAWTDYGGDGDAEGVALRVVDPQAASSGAPAHANQTTAFSQYHPDILWTGSELIVAWEDTSNASTGPDLRYRSFNSSLAPNGNETTLAATTAYEEDVALASFGGGWAAAWRSASNATESIVVQTSSGPSWSVGPFLPGPYDAAPALAQLDSTHMLLVYTEGVDALDSGVANESIVRGALLDTANPGSVVPFDVTTITVTDAGASPSAYFPNAVSVGSRVFVAWATSAVTADPNGEELWLKEVGWNGSSLDLTIPERPLPRWDAHRLGDQRLPALAASPLGPGGAIASAWDDLGNVFSNEANGDVAVELIPVPVLRLTNLDGGGL